MDESLSGFYIIELENPVDLNDSHDAIFDNIVQQGKLSYINTALVKEMGLRKLYQKQPQIYLKDLLAQQNKMLLDVDFLPYGLRTTGRHDHCEVNPTFTGIFMHVQHALKYEIVEDKLLRISGVFNSIKVSPKVEIGFKEFLRALPFAIVFRDAASNRFIECNKRFEDLFGYKKNEIMGRHRYFLRREHDEEYTALMERLLQKQIVKKYASVSKYYRKNGSWFYGETYRSKYYIDDKDIIISFVSDVTERELAKKELAKSESVFREIYESNSVGLTQVDFSKVLDEINLLKSKGVKDIQKHIEENPDDYKKIISRVRMNDINPKMQEMLEGDSKEESIKNMFHVFGFAVDNVWKDELHAIFNNMEGFGSQIKIRTFKGNEKYFYYSVIYPEDNDFSNINYTYVDITEQVKAKELLDVKVEELDKQRLELKSYIESNLELEKFAYITSHDLREPLRTIVGFSQILKNKSEDRLNKEEKEYLEYIVSAGKNMNNLIEDILMYSRVKSDDVHFSNVHMKLLLEEIKKDLSESIEENNVLIKIDPHLPNAVFGNHTYLYQLFQNLIKNAIKFKKPIIQPIVEIKYKDRVSHHQFEVKDNGIGIEEEYFDRIFLLFKRLHSSSVYDGTGIGLAVCKKVVNIHKGEIRVESEVGKGTSFIFTLQK